MIIGPPLTWDDLAREYRNRTGGNARIRPMQSIFDWAERETKVFFIHPLDETIHLLLDAKDPGNLIIQTITST